MGEFPRPGRHASTTRLSAPLASPIALHSDDVVRLLKPRSEFGVEILWDDLDVTEGVEHGGVVSSKIKYRWLGGGKQAFEGIGPT